MFEKNLKALAFSKNSYSTIKSFQDVIKIYEKQQDFDFILFITGNPYCDEFNELTKLLNIHQLSVEDCRDENNIPKLDVFSNYIFVLMNLFNLNKANNELIVDEIDIILSSKFILIVYKSSNYTDEFFNKWIENITNNIKIYKKSTDFTLYLLIDFVIEYNYKILSYFEDILENLEESLHSINSSITKNFQPSELIKLRKNFILLRKSFFYQREVLVKLCRHDTTFINHENIFYFRDILDSITKFFEFVEVDREMISNIFEIYLSIKNNQLNEISLQTNEVMKRLTLITTIFMPLTLIASIGGMSEYSAITGGTENWIISYSLFIIAMIVLGWLSYITLKWKKWI